MRKIIVVFAILFAFSVLSVNAQVAPEAVGCGPRIAWVKGSNPLGGGMALRATETTLINGLTVSLEAEKGITPFTSALLYIDGVNVAVALVSGQSDGVSQATFAFESELQTGTHMFQIYVVNEIMPSRMSLFYGERVDFTIRKAADLSVISGNVEIAFPTNLGSVVVTPVVLEGATERIGPLVRPRVAQDVIAEMAITPQIVVDEDVALVEIKGLLGTHIRRLSIWVVNENGNVIGSGHVRGNNNFVITLDQPVVLDGAERKFRIVVDSQRFSEQELYISWGSLTYTVGKRRLATSDCQALGQTVVRYP